MAPSSGRGAVEVSADVWSRWKAAEDSHKPSISLLLSGGAPPELLVRAVRAACDDATGVREERRPESGEWRPGSCRVSMAPRGALLQIADGPDAFEKLIGLIVKRLERDGVNGRIEVYEGRVVPLPDLMPLIESRARVVGERYWLGRKSRWRAEPEALWRLISAGAAWCQSVTGARQTSLAVAAMPRAPVARGRAGENQIRDAVRQAATQWFTFATEGDGSWRIMSVSPSDGGVSLVETGERVLEADEWPLVVDGLRWFLVDARSDLVYAFMKHGSMVGAAAQQSSLFLDWPQREGVRAAQGIGVAFEDEFVPDAFPLQMLGPGHDLHLPRKLPWYITDVGGGRVLVEHKHPERWFNELMVPFGGSRNLKRPLPAAPKILEASRKAFDEILFRDEIETLKRG